MPSDILTLARAVTAFFEWEAIGAIGTVVTGGAAVYIASKAYAAERHRERAERGEADASALAAAEYIFRSFISHRNRLATLTRAANAVRIIPTGKAVVDFAEALGLVDRYALVPIERVLSGVGHMEVSTRKLVLRAYADEHHLQQALYPMAPSLRDAAQEIGEDNLLGDTTYEKMGSVFEVLARSVTQLDETIDALKDMYGLKEADETPAPA